MKWYNVTYVMYFLLLESDINVISVVIMIFVSHVRKPMITNML